MDTDQTIDEAIDRMAGRSGKSIFRRISIIEVEGIVVYKSEASRGGDIGRTEVQDLALGTPRWIEDRLSRL